MPASDISRITHSFPAGVSEWVRAACASLANEAAKTQVAERLRSGALDRNNPGAVNATFKQIYYAEYYRNMNFYEQNGSQAPRVVYIESENRSAKKFYGRHTVANFSRTNCFVHVHRNRITVGRFNYPIDGDESPETKEAFVAAWPGPLDKADNRLIRKIAEYIDTLWQHDSQRIIKYCDSANDERRKVILRLLRELLHQNGTIDAAGTTRLLLGSEKTEINKEESNRKPIETIQKYLLLGKRGDAIKFARFKRLYDHAQCLAFLDKYQPPNAANYIKDGPKLKDDPIVQLNDEYITSIDYGVLNTVYRSLLNRIIETDPESRNIIKRPNVANDNYEFAILSANDCEMDFDQSNEVFKLIKAVKQVSLDPYGACRHLISLGFTYIERPLAFERDTIDDMSNRSHLSFKPGDNYASRTLAISNIDMLIFNEIWEYCLNLAKRTCNPTSYEYITDLIPYKLIFASRLFDYGLHDMFAQYIVSIRNALAQARTQQFVSGDQFYDWETIERSVEHLFRTWELFQISPETLPQYGAPSSDSIPYQQTSTYDSGFYLPPAMEPVHSAPSIVQNDVPHYTNDHNNMAWDDQPAREPEPPKSLPPPPPPLAQPHQPVTAQESFPYQPPYNMDPHQQLNSLPDMSRYQSRADHPDSSHPNQEYQAMKSSSPVNKSRQSMGDSFPFSPIQEGDGMQSNSSSRRESAAVPNDVINNEHVTQQPGPSNNSGNNSKSQPSGDQQPNFLYNLMGTAKSLLPKSNSKPMILPDDTNKTIDYDHSRGQWVNISDPNGALEDEINDAPPKMSTAEPPRYSFKKSTRGRYPAPSFQ